MIRLFWLLFWGALSVLMVTAGVKARARKQAALAAALPKLDDDAIRSIEDTGALPLDEEEPLDLHEIGEEEQRFWSETWEEPEEL